MLIRPARSALLALALLAAACEAPRDALERPLTVEARYRLLYNDVLVGQALFALEIDADRHYRLEAFTVPAGQMEKAARHEVLETSQGALDADAVRPSHFEHSVMQDGQIEVVRLSFDWDARKLRLSGSQGERELALLPGTQDRLSYLLAARRLAADGAGETGFRVASAEASEDTRLQVVGRGPVAVPLGHYQAVAVRRIGPDADESRTLWFDTDFAPLPLRIVQARDGSTVEMQLEGFSRRPNGPR